MQNLNLIRPDREQKSFAENEPERLNEIPTTISLFKEIIETLKKNYKSVKMKLGII